MPSISGRCRVVPRFAAVVLAALVLAACLLCLIGIAWADDEPLVTVSASQWADGAVRDQAAGQEAADGESLDEGASDGTGGATSEGSLEDASVSSESARGEGTVETYPVDEGRFGFSSLGVITSANPTNDEGTLGASAKDRVASGGSSKGAEAPWLLAGTRPCWMVSFGRR